MIIVSQDRCTAINFKNVEIIGIGAPLEYNESKYKILCNTTSDDQYIIAKYHSEERAKEVMQDILKRIAKTKYLLKPRSNFLNPKRMEEAKNYMEEVKNYFEKINEDRKSVV